MNHSAPWTSLASGLTSGVTCVVRICEFAYALNGVDQQTEQYLKVANHAADNIMTAKRLLRERMDLLPAAEKKEYERVIKDTENALKVVQDLLEPARVDKEADHKIKLTTRAMWVLRDNPYIVAALSRLDIVHGTLNTSIVSLRLVRAREEYAPLSPPIEKGSPPSYEASELVAWRRKSMAQRGHPVMQIEGLGLLVPDGAVLDETAETPRRPRSEERQIERDISPGTAGLPVELEDTAPHSRHIDRRQTNTMQRHRSWLAFHADRQG